MQQVDREQIKSTVLRFLARAVDQHPGHRFASGPGPRIDPRAVDTSQSMKDLGANSIDIVEVVSSTMRELRIKIPRAELNRLTNIDELIDLLNTRAQDKDSS